MSHNRRKFLSLTALSAGALTFSNSLFAKNGPHGEYDLPKSISDLQPMKDGIVPRSEEHTSELQSH